MVKMFLFCLIFCQVTLTAIINAMVINKKTSKIQKFVEITFLGTAFFEILFAGTISIEVLFVASMISSHVITESPITFPTYLPFLQVHEAGF